MIFCDELFFDLGLCGGGGRGRTAIQYKHRSSGWRKERFQRESRCKSNRRSRTKRAREIVKARMRSSTPLSEKVNMLWRLNAIPCLCYLQSEHSVRTEYYGSCVCVAWKVSNLWIQNAICRSCCFIQNYLYVTCLDILEHRTTWHPHEPSHERLQGINVWTHASATYT